MPPPPLTSPPCPSRWRQQASSMANWTHALLIDAMWRASLRFSAGRSPGVITSRRIVHARAPRPMGALDLLIAAPRMSNGWRSSASSCPRIVLHAVARRPESSFRHRGGGGADRRARTEIHALLARTRCSAHKGLRRDALAACSSQHGGALPGWHLIEHIQTPAQVGAGPLGIWIRDDTSYQPRVAPSTMRDDVSQLSSHFCRHFLSGVELWREWLRRENACHAKLSELSEAI